MTSESADGSKAAAATLEDLPANIRRSLLRGFGAGHWWSEDGSEPAGADFILDEQAFGDGKLLGEAVSMLISADLADYSTDKRHYDRLADELNERYGPGLVVHSDELGPNGPGPGFRTRSGPDS